MTEEEKAEEEIELIASRIRNDMRKRIEFCDNVGITLDDYYAKQCGDFEIEDMVRAFENGKVIDKEENDRLLGKIADLKKKNIKLEEQNTKWKEDYIALENLKDNQIADLEKKVNENDICIEDLELSNIDLQKQLEQAKVIIKNGLEGIKRYFIVAGKERPFEKEALLLINLFCDKAEQFLKEIEK